MTDKGWLSIEKNVIKGDKMLYYNYQKLFSFSKNWFFWVSIRNFPFDRKLVFSSEREKDWFRLFEK